MNLLACYETCTTAHTLLYCLIGQAVHTAGKRSSNSIWSQETSVLISTTFNITRLYRSEETIFLFKVFKKNHLILFERIELSYLLESIDPCQWIAPEKPYNSKGVSIYTRSTHHLLLLQRLKQISIFPFLFHFNLHKHRATDTTRYKYTFHRRLTCTVTRFITRALILISVRLCIYDNRVLPSSSPSANKCSVTSGLGYHHSDSRSHFHNV